MNEEIVKDGTALIAGENRDWRYVPSFGHKYIITKDGLLCKRRGFRPLWVRRNNTVMLYDRGIGYTYNLDRLYAEVWILGRALKVTEACYRDGEGVVRVGEWRELVDRGIISSHYDGRNQLARQYAYAPDIRYDYSTGAYTVMELARKYHIEGVTIGDILRQTGLFEPAVELREGPVAVREGSGGVISPYRLAERAGDNPRASEEVCG